MPRLIKRIFLLVLSFAVCQCSPAQPTGPGWYHSFSGAIGKTMITMHLHKLGHEYYGYYYYDRTQEPIYINGNDTTETAGQIQLLAYVPGRPDTNETFILHFVGAALQGNWFMDEKSKPLVVTLREKRPAIPFDMIYTTGDLKLRPHLPESPSASYFGASVWPLENSNTSKFLKSIISEEFGEKAVQDEIGNILQAEKNRILNAYVEENRDLPDSLFEAFSPAYNLLEDRKLLVAFESSNLLILANHIYAYTGGAHGNYGTRFSSLDLATRKKLKLSDVFTPGGIKNLRAELEKEFRQQAGLKAAEPLTEAGLFENSIEPNDNFYVTAKGIGFSYMPYEIGPYARGEISLFLPFTRLTSYLQPAAKKWAIP